MVNFEQVIEELVGVRGTLACAIVDYESGMLLDGRSVADMDLDILSACNTEIVRAEIKSIALMHEKDGQHDEIEDMLITLGTRYYLLRPMKSYPGLFVFSILDKSNANLALARRALKDADRHFNA